MPALILFYFMLGFGGASWLKHGNDGASVSKIPTPLWEQILPYAAILALLALPVLGYKQAVKRGEFLRMSAGMWIAMPLIAIGIGLGVGFYF